MNALVPPERFEPEMAPDRMGLAATGVRTTCPYCGVGCGVIATPDGKGGAGIAGDAAHPANFGRLCVKGSALGETLSTEHRLLHPTIHGVRTTWNRALDAVAAGFSKTLAEHGPDAIAFYLSGQLLTEDYYVANKLAKGFLGTSNVDTNSRLCMASTVAGHRRAFGGDIVPGNYEDLDEADLIVLVGSNTAWCHPVLFQRMEQAKATRGATIVTIDPRRTATSESADLHLSIAPGMDSVLFAHLLVELAARSLVDERYVADHTSGFEAALDKARIIAPDLQTAARRCGLIEAELAAFVELWTRTPKVVTCFSQGVNQSAQGTDKVNAILNVHLATARIGKPGAGPFSLTGQPNAMGGREVGGLANQLAAHMSFNAADIDRVGRFWNAPSMARKEGLKAVDMFEAIEGGRIKALWILCTNPAVSLPRADAMRAALKRLDFLAVSEVSAKVDGILGHATVVLPAAAWGEKDGTVTNSERRISRQRAMLTPPGEARPDWWQVCEVARRMGFGEAFSYASPAAIFREHAALSAFENNGVRAFDIGALAGISDAGYDALEPVRWPLPAGASSGAARLFADGRFFHPDRKARFIAIEDPKLFSRTSTEYPLLLNTGRVRDQWHTMARTGLAPRLGRHRAFPYLEIHPDDAMTAGLEDGGVATVKSVDGEVQLRVVVTPGQRRGMVFAPIHWSDATAGRGRVGALIHAAVDPVSGQPESKAVPISLEPVAIASAGFIVTRRLIEVPAWLGHARIAVKGGEAVSFVSTRSPQALHALLSNWLRRGASPLMRSDPATGAYSSASIVDDRLDLLLVVGREIGERSLDWGIDLLDREQLDAGARRHVLAGRAPAGGAPASPIICVCHGIDRRCIEGAVRGGCTSVELVGATTRAGTNCGSCRPEIRQILKNILVEV